MPAKGKGGEGGALKTPVAPSIQAGPRAGCKLGAQHGALPGFGVSLCFFLKWDDAGLFRSASTPSRDGTRTGTCRGILARLLAVLFGWMLF